MEIALIFSSTLLLIAYFLRAKIKILQLLFLPAAIIGGLLGLIVLQLGQRTKEYFIELNWLSEQSTAIIGELRAWPGFLIAVVFAGLFLDKPGKSLKESLRNAVRQANMVWIICLGQLSFGLLAVHLIIQPLQLGPFERDVPPYFGQLIETGFAGGHGTAAAVGNVYQKMGYGEASDLAFFMATIGLIYSVVSGMIFIHLGVRRGWTHAGHVNTPPLGGPGARKRSESIGFSKVSAEVLDPLVFQAAILSGAYTLGLILQRLTGLVYEGLPLFMFTLIGGWLVRDTMRSFGVGDLIDPATMRRLTAAAMEFLIVAAIASLNLSLVVKAIVPLSILLFVAFGWTALCLIYIGRQLLPSGYWFELGMINYGMSTGVTASGLMLLRIIDPDFDSGAAEDYALAAPLSSPFVGGGLVSVVIIPSLLLSLGVGPTALVTLSLTAAMYWLGLIMARR